MRALLFTLALLSLIPSLAGCSKKKKPTLITFLTDSQKMKGALGYSAKAAHSKDYHRGEARLRAARLYLEIQRMDKARASLKAIVHDPKSARRTRARAAFLLCAHWGEAATCLLPIIRKYPDTVAAEDALGKYLPVLRRRGMQHLIDTLAMLGRQLRKTNLSDNIIFLMGSTLATAQGTITLGGRSMATAEAAFACFKQLYSGYPNSSLRDDAIYEGAKILHRLHRTREAISLLSGFLGGRKSSWFFGVYNSHLMDDAWLLRATLYIESGNFAKGFKQLLGLAREFPKSRLRDDAHYKAVRAALAGGHGQQACAAARSFVKHYPRSRYHSAVSRIATRCGGRP